MLTVILSDLRTSFYANASENSVSANCTLALLGKKNPWQRAAGCVEEGVFPLPSPPLTPHDCFREAIRSASLTNDPESQLPPQALPADS